MSLFDQLVEDAINNTRDLAPLRVVVELVDRMLDKPVAQHIIHAGLPTRPTRSKCIDNI